MSRRPSPPVVGAALLALVAVLAVAARFGRPLAGLDRVVLDAVLARRTAGGVHLARTVTDTGAGPFLFPLVAAAGIAVRLRTGSWRPGLDALVAAGLGVAARFGLAQLVREPRPAAAFRAVPVGGYSFPSGHTVTSALIAGTLAYLLSRLLRPRWAVSAALLLGAWAVLVGLSRVYLGVHWLSDVVAGWLFAAAVLTVLVGRHGRSPSAGAAEGGPRWCAPDLQGRSSPPESTTSGPSDGASMAAGAGAARFHRGLRRAVYRRHHESPAGRLPRPVGMTGPTARKAGLP